MASFLTLFLFTVLGHGEPAAYWASVPESVVRISVYDLVEALPAKAGPPAYRLPADYGQRVAYAINEKRDLLKNCRVPGDQEQIKVLVKLVVNSAGEATAELAEPRSSDERGRCLARALGEISYPKHKLKHPVTVEFPLTWRNEVM